MWMEPSLPSVGVRVAKSLISKFTTDFFRDEIHIVRPGIFGILILIEEEIERWGSIKCREKFLSKVEMI